MARCREREQGDGYGKWVLDVGSNCYIRGDRSQSGNVGDRIAREGGSQHLLRQKGGRDVRRRREGCVCVCDAEWRGEGRGRKWGRRKWRIEEGREEEGRDL